MSNDNPSDSQPQPKQPPKVLKPVDIETASKISDLGGNKNLEAIKENNRFTTETKKNTAVIWFGSLMIVCQIAFSIVNTRITLSSIKTIREDTKIETTEKVKSIEELNNNLYQENIGLFQTTIGLIIGFLIGNNLKNN